MRIEHVLVFHYKKNDFDCADGKRQHLKNGINLVRSEFVKYLLMLKVALQIL